jgi:hypothetical protein
MENSPFGFLFENTSTTAAYVDEPPPPPPAEVDPFKIPMKIVRRVMDNCYSGDGTVHPGDHLLFRDFYFRPLGSLVVLSFPQPLSFSSVLPKPLSETLTRSSDGRNPVKLTVGSCWQVGSLLVPRSGHASTYPDHRGTRNLSMLARRTHSLPRCPLQNGSLSQPHARAHAFASPFFPCASLFFFSASGSPSLAGG